jgi:hypothetical protein
VYVLIALGVLALQPAAIAAAGCCDLGRGDQAEVTLGESMQPTEDADGFPIPLPWPFPPIPIGCFSTDDAAACERMGGTHYQLGVCANGECQPTAEAGEDDEAVCAI